MTTDPTVPAPAAVATSIATQLGEADTGPQWMIRQIVAALGPTVAQELADQATAIDAGEGMLVQDGSRRRTLGGVFFTLAKQRLPSQLRWRIFATGRARPPRRAPTTPPATPAPAASTPAPAAPPFVWEERQAVLDSITEKGPVRTVKVTIVGRPGKIIEQGDCIVTVMQNNAAPALPKGLPTPPSTPTSYGVYIARKQWKGVAEAIANAEDALIVEGWATYDPALKGMAIFATSVTTRLLQQAKRQTPSERS